MRTLRNSIAVIAIIIGLAVAAGADDADKANAPEAPKELKNQTHCPVMGGKIDSTVYTDIQGQRVYHCCPMCSAKLKADPDKYFKKAAAEGVLFENIQTTCPVSGKKLENKSIYADYEGRRIAFCSENCRVAFNEDPGKYLQRMDGPPSHEAGMQEKMNYGDEGGHQH
jgi:YHS domain-containing protein